MKRPLSLLRRAARWVLRFRHRRGYGIHSPFAFSLVTDVIYNRGTYYAYAPLHALQRDVPRALSERDDRLLLRLINAAAPRQALACGPSLTVTLHYLRAGRPSALLRAAATAAEGCAAVDALTTIDFLYVDAVGDWEMLWRTAAQHAGEKAFFVVRGIHRNADTLRAWRRLTAASQVRVTFDLYRLGIACFEQRLNKQDYVINYF
jgi:hypothetical protein